MVGIIGAFNFNSNNMRTLFRLLKHRGESITTQEIKLNRSSQNITVVLGICQNDEASKLYESEKGLILCDSLFDLSQSEALRIDQLLQKEYLESNEFDFIFDNQGIVMISVDQNGIRIWRSLDGQKAIYYGKRDAGAMFATEKKVLWEAGCKDVKPIIPGYTLQIDNDEKLGHRKIQAFSEEPWQESKQLAVEDLCSYLQQSIQRLQGLRCGMLFSGGVDSSLLAHIVSKVSDDLILYSASSMNSRDKEHTRYAADILNLDIRQIHMGSDEIWSILPEVVFAIETTNKMDIEIATPFFLCAREAAKDGIDFLVSGQGPDEQFAGYAKHLSIYQKDGASSVEKQLRKEVSITHEVNISRDERAVAFHGLPVHFPYLDSWFVGLALSLPANWKVQPNGFPKRKVIFRELAGNLGLDPTLTKEPKKATQFSSGSSKLLVKALKENVDHMEKMTTKEAIGETQGILDFIGSCLFPKKMKHKEVKMDMTYIEITRKSLGI